MADIPVCLNKGAQITNAPAKAAHHHLPPSCLTKAAQPYPQDIDQQRPHLGAGSFIDADCGAAQYLFR